MNRISKVSSGLKDNFKIASTNVKDKVTFHHEYDKDDELIERFKEDIKKSIKGLGYVKSSTKKMALNYWPKLFKTNLKVVGFFIHLLGEESLHFKGIEEWYEDFDKFSMASEVPLVHPKERELLVSSINEELNDYRATIAQLSFAITKDWELHYQQLKIRIDQMVGYLKDVLKLMKKRLIKKIDYNRFHNKIEKIQKKTTPLEDKELEKLSAHEDRLKRERSAYEKLDNKLKTILPHVLSFLEEFVDDITKLVLYKHQSTYEEVLKNLKYYSVYHGFLDNSINQRKNHTANEIAGLEELRITPQPQQNKYEAGIQSYESIKNSWEAAITGTRLQIESFVKALSEKHPELIDSEIDASDKSSNATKVWNKISGVVPERTHKIKPKDHVNGIFSDYLAVDPLDAFKQFQDPEINKSETYHPFRQVDIDDVLVPEQFATASSPPLPPLPPRTHTKPLPRVAAHNVTTPLPPTPNPQFSSAFPQDEEEDDDDDDASSIISETSDSSVSISSDIVLHHSAPDVVKDNLAKIYNKSKNKITTAPTLQNNSLLDIHSKHSDLFDKTATVSYKLDRISKLYEKVLSENTDHKILRANTDFRGEEPGDLSFSKGDEIEILLDFQSIHTLYVKDDKHWLIGVSRGKSDNFRIGFVPSNFFD